MAAEKGSEFIVKLNGLKLPSDVESKIEREIRATVMRELGKLDLGPSAIATLGKIRQWRGLWLDLTKKFAVPKATVTLEE